VKAGGNMKRYFNFTLILTLLLALSCFSANAQTIQPEARLDKTSMPIGDQTVLHISAHMPAKTDITFPELVDSIGKVKIVNSLKADTVADKNNPGLETISHNYTVTSFDTGVYVLPEFTFHTKNGDIKTGTVTLQITAVPVDTTKAFYDIKQPFAVSWTFWDWLKLHWLIITIILAVILITIGIMYYLQKRPKAEVVVKAAPILPLDTIALNKLYELRDKKLWQQNEVKQYYSELSDVLREYLEKRYQVAALEQTTDEIFTSLKNRDIPQESRKTLKQILTLADLVKFAKEKPEAMENEQSMENAIGFIVSTKQVPKPVDNKEDLPK
jgi:hypothetical protein